MFEKIKPVGLTARAAEEVRKIMHTKNIPDGYGLRVGIRGGGCGGVGLMIGFDKERPTDITYSLEGITIHIDKKHTMYLIGKEVDFYDEADARGVMFVDQQKSASN